MNRKELLEIALKETGSLTKAIELVKEWVNLEEGTREEHTPSNPQATTPVWAEFSKTAREATKTANEILASTLSSFTGKTQRISKLKRKRWTQEEAALATSMFDNGFPIPKVAHSLNRSEKSIRDALSVGHIKPKIDPRNPKLRAAALKGVITMGKNLLNYDEAQKLIDQA